MGLARARSQAEPSQRRNRWQQADCKESNMNRTYLTLSLALIAATLIASGVIYPMLPETVPTHWNIQGQVDGYGPKSVAAFLIPSMLVVLLLVLLILPWLSPKQFEIDTFRSTYGFIS